ncbi:MAG: DUF481 domain-containing protein [Nitrospira sp. LK70]|nr:DUF481 domain-containing protein [Nitrospira sp. LK70]
MKQSVLLIAILILTTVVNSVFADDGPAPITPTAAPPLDVVTLKDGSVIYGEVIEMTDGVLQIKNALAAEVIKVKWAEVSKLAVSHPLPFHLKEGTMLVGTAEEGEPGMLRLKAGPTGGIITVPMDTVIKVNPIIQPPVIYVGNLNAAYTQVVGNAHLTTASFVGDFVGRSEQLRLTLLGRYVYGAEDGSVTARNARATIKLDYFLTKRLYWFSSAYFETDEFQDLKLRTALASGPGYQWIEKGDFSGIYKDMAFYAEAGPGYFNEDFSTVPDQVSFRARVATKFDWSLFNELVTLHHDTEMFPSLQNLSDFYLTMNNSIRFKMWGGLTTGFQVTTRYNSRPAPGTVTTDNMYFLTFGYAFDTTRKR